MIPVGVADFAFPVAGDGGDLFGPFGGRGPFAVAPVGLRVATDGVTGRPDFRLSLVRSDPGAARPEPHGVLEVGLRLEHAPDRALSAARGVRPDATVTPLWPTAGRVMLRSFAAGDDDAPSASVPFDWAGNETAVARLRLTPNEAALARRALTDDTLTVEARVLSLLPGVSPRVPARVRFNPRTLVAALRQRFPGTDAISQAAVTDLLRQEAHGLPLTIEGDPMVGGRRDTFAEALTDRLRDRFTEAVFGPADTRVPHLLPTEMAPDGAFVWDLGEPHLTARPWVVSLSPLDAAKGWAREHGEGQLVSLVEVRSLPTGVWQVDVSADLPRQRSRADAIGVTLTAPPRPPVREHGVTATVEFDPPAAADSARLRLSPVEPLEYTATAYAVLAGPGGVVRLEGTPREGREPILRLRPTDLPVRYATVTADPELLIEGGVRGLVRWESQSAGEWEQAFRLTVLEPTAALPVAAGAVRSEVRLWATPPDAAEVPLGTFEVGTVRVGLFSLPGYGPQQVEVRAEFAAGVPLWVVELLSAKGPTEPTVFALTPDRPTREWAWFASSPFRSGYRYRSYPPDREQQATWHDGPPPGHSLVVPADPTRGGTL